MCRQVCFHYFMIINFHARFMNLASNSSLTSTGVISVLLPPESREPWQNNPFYELINTSFFFLERNEKELKLNIVSTIFSHEVYVAIRPCYVSYLWYFCVYLLSNLSRNIKLWGPFLKSHGNLPGPISIFGDKCYSTEVNFVSFGLTKREYI